MSARTDHLAWLEDVDLDAAPVGDPDHVLGLDGAVVKRAVVATVWVHDGSTYQATGGRIFIGPEDPALDGFTLADGDQWESTA